MALLAFQSTYSWQQAISLGPQLGMLAEELPASEQMGLCWHLQQVAVDLPAAIALDLLQDGSQARLPALLRLVSALEIVEQIYPALDTLQLRQDVNDLMLRLSSDRFAEQSEGSAPRPPEAPVAVAPVGPAPAPVDLPPAPTVPAPPPEVPTSAPVEPPVAPTTVPVVPSSDPAASVPVTPSETNV